MTVAEIRQILEGPYNRKVWKHFLQTQFTNNKLNAEDREIVLVDNTLSKQCLSLGNYEINQYTKIGIFEIKLKDKVNISRNRVALRNLIKSLTQQMSGAMVVFVQGDKWRFSYISKRKVKNTETNEIQDKETASKRYTYLFGKGEKALTAAQRFDKLIQKQKDNLFDLLSLDDFEEAFSVEKLSKEFFANYKKTYEDFVAFLTGKRYVKKGSKYTEQTIGKPDWQLTNLFNKDEKQARDFVKRMMGRIVFLYFIQKKGWLAVPKDKKWGEGNLDYLYDLYKNSKQKDDFYARELVPLFFNRLNNADSENTARDERFPYLNGGLFDDTQDKKYSKLHLPENIFEQMFETFNNYNFTIYEDAPDEHTVAVDPEMLGHIFENLLEDNKDKGAFYTPKEIVHYMCKESLKAYLLSNEELKTKNETLAFVTIDKIINQQELDKDEAEFAEKNAFKIIDALKQVKICDPAIGSGAFPMGLLQEIFNAQIFLLDLSGFVKKITEAEIKKHIIEESIYGVDIDAGAVDIARLRFWLSLVVDEEVPQPLPNLDFKIICANTLIPLGEVKELDMDANASLAVKELEQIRHDFFNVSSENKLNLERQFKKVQNDLLNLRELATSDNYEIYTKLYEFNPFDFEAAPCSWFDPWWMFGVKGFDIVIGNPPYIKEPTNKNAFDGFRKTKYYQGKMDLWYGFACVMLDNLKKDTGVLSFIATNNWVTNAGASKMRNKVAEDAQIMQLIDFGNYKIFESADIQTMIMLFKANDKEAEYKFDYQKITDTQVELDDINQLFAGVHNNKVQILTPTFNREQLKDKSFLFSESRIDNILNDILNVSNFKLNGKLEIAQGIVPNPDVVSKSSLSKIPSHRIEEYRIKDGDGVFVIKNEEISVFPENERKIIKPLWEPYEIEKFYLPEQHEKSIIYYTKKENPKEYSKVIEHLEKYREIMDDRRENQQGKLKFYHLHWPRDIFFFEKGQKILGIRKCQKPTFAYTENEAFVMMAVNVIKCDRINPKYLTALLNSKLIAFWLRHKGKMQGFQYQVDKAPLEELPLITTNHESTFASLVDYILFLKANIEQKINEYVNNEHIIQSFEDVINACVYELYFAEHMKKKEIDVLRFAKDLIKPIDKPEMAKEIINAVYSRLKEPSNEIRNRMMLFATRSENILLPIQKIY